MKKIYTYIYTYTHRYIYICMYSMYAYMYKYVPCLSFTSARQKHQNKIHSMFTHLAIKSDAVPSFEFSKTDCVRVCVVKGCCDKLEEKKTIHQTNKAAPQSDLRSSKRRTRLRGR